jgi:hypothetical protein
VGVCVGGVIVGVWALVAVCGLRLCARPHRYFCWDICPLALLGYIFVFYCWAISESRSGRWLLPRDLQQRVGRSADFLQAFFELVFLARF